MKSVKEAAIQFLSPVLGSAAVVAAAALGLETLATVVLVTVDVVLVVVAAGFSAGFAVGPVVGSSAAGLASAVACEIFHLPLRVMSAKSSTLSEVHRLIGLFGCLPSRSLRKLLLGMPASRSPLQRNSF